MVLTDGGFANQMSAVVLVLAEIRQFREFVITNPDASNKMNSCTYLMRELIKKILAK